MGDPLVLVPTDKWLGLKSVLDRDWPRCIQAETLAIHKDWTEKGVKHEFKVYCPYGDFNSGMVSVNNKLSFYEIIVLSPKDDTSAIEEALKKTKVIDWKKRIEFAFAPRNIVECMNRVTKELGLEMVAVTRLKMYILEKGSPLFDLCIPEALSFGPLHNRQAKLMNDVWPHKYADSLEYLKFFIETNSGCGLYLHNDLIGWVLIRENGPLLHLYVLEEYRRRGYGALILKYMSNELLKRNKDVVAYCVFGNDSASKMYEKLNFKNHGCVEFCHYETVKKD